MERRQIITLTVVVLLILFLSFLNYIQGSKVKSQNAKKTNVSKTNGEVKGISEKLDSGLRFIEDKAGEIIQNTTTYVIDQASNSANSLTNEVIKNTTQNILNQIEKLPQSQQDAIKDTVCK